MKKKRKVLSLWATILLVVGALLAILGITALVVYLTRSEEKEKVYPQSITAELVSGSLGYQVGSNFYVSDEFEMVINGDSEEITEKSVTLSFNNEVTPQNGYISNGRIRLPQKVTLGRKFEVELVSVPNSAVGENVVVGGFSQIKARSANTNLTPTNLGIYVDVPVYDFQAGIIKGDTLDESGQVVVGDVFQIGAKFTPADSQKVYNNAAELKEIFIEPTKSSHIKIDYATKKIEALRPLDSNEQPDEIVVYTFLNGYYRNLALERVAAKGIDKDNPAQFQQFNNEVLAFFRDQERNNVVAYESDTLQIDIKQVNIEPNKFILNVETASDIRFDKYYTLYMANGGNNLGISLKDTAGNEQYNLYSGVGIKLPSEDYISITGGRVVRVVKNDDDYSIESISYTEYLEEKKNNTYLGASYYILPDTSQPDSRDYFWKFDVSQPEGVEVSEFNLTVNFFYNKGGELTNLLSFEEEIDKNLSERSLKLEMDRVTVEVQPIWKGREAIDLVLTYDKDGKLEPADVDLSLMITKTETNVYDKVVFFLLRNGKGDGDDQEFNDAFPNLGGRFYKFSYDGVTPQEIAIYNTDPYRVEGGDSKGYYLYELQGSSLQALKSYSKDVVKVIAATVKTRADGSLYYDEDGAYKIVKYSQPLEVNASSTLSITNMTPTFEIDTTEDGETDIVDENYYIVDENAYVIPAIIRNKAGAPKDVIKFYLEIGDDDIEETKVRNANLSIRCYINGEPLLVDGLTEELLRMSRLTKIEDDPEGRNIYTANLVIEEQLVNRLHSKIETVPHVNIDNGIKLDLRLVYNDGEKDSEPKQVKCRTEGKETASIILYYPKPTSAGNLKVGYKDSKYADETIEALVDAETPIDVSVTSKSTGNEDGINISWGSLTGLTIEDLNNYLTCTLVDQYGRNVNDNIGVYRLEFYETDEKGQPQNLISLQDQNKKIGSFLSTSGETKKAKLSVKIRDILLDEFVKDAAGNDISSPEVNFNITSQGVTHIEVDTNKTVGEYDFKASQTSNKLEVRKIVTGNVQDAAGNAEIILNNIIKVWLDNSWEDQDKKEQSKVTDLIFTLSTNNSFVSSDLLNVIAFYSGTDALTEADLFTKNIEKISLNYAINRNIPLQFNISNETGIIQLSLTLILLPDVTLTPNFNGIEGREYLVSQDLAAGVFGGTSYDLKDIINVSFNDGTTQSDTRYTNWEEYGIANSDDGDGILSIKNGELAIANVYRLTQASLTIYYGNKAFSQYALQVSIMVYVNPNYIIVQNSQDLDLNSLSSATFTDNHKIYSALDYIKENGEVSELEEIKLENIIKGAGDSFAFNFKSANNQLLQLDNSVDNIGKYRFNSNWTDPLNMPLGQREKQTFNINFKIGDSEYFFHAFKKVGSGNIEKPDSTKAFTFDDYMTIGDDPTQLLIVSDNISEKIATVVYNGEKRLILKSGVTYKPASSNVTIDAMSSKIASSLANNNFQVKADITNFVDFADNNNIRFTKTIADSADSKAKTIAVSTTLKVIISREVGDRFVKYSNSQNYNEYKYSNEKFADFSEFFRSDSTQIAEKFEAGREYTILYNTPPETTGGDKYAGLGFYSAYYDEAHLANHKVEIVQGQQYGRVEGNKLTIYHLENSVKDAYILLRLTITDTTIGTISWYYRIEVEPSFTAGEANYPFTSEGEYLDADSDYYKESEKGSEYEIQVDKTFSEKNSKFTEREDKTRFIDPKLNEGFSENKFVAENERYRIGRILNSTGQEIQQDSISCVFTNAAGESNENNIGDSTHNILHISGVANQVVTIELIKYFVDKNDTIPGSEIVYLLRFNQGQNYRIELSGFKDKQGFENTEVSGNGTNYKSQIVLPETDKGTYLYGLNISEVNGNLENSLSGDSVTAFAYSESSDVTVNSLSSSEDEPAGEGTLKVGYYFGYDEDSKQFKLTIKLAGTIAEDKVLKIAFFTAQRRALMLEVTITKQIKLDVEEILNKNLYVGETYKFVGEDDSTNSLLKSSFSTDYSDYTVQVENIVTEDNKMLYIDNTENTIQFAYSKEDYTVKLQLTFTKDLDTFSHVFEFTVKASKEDNKILKDEFGDYVYSDNTVYGGKTYNIQIDDVLNSFGLTTGGKHNFTFEEVVGSEGDKFELTNNDTTKDTTLSLTPDYVNTSTPKTYTVYVNYKFDTDGHSIEQAFKFTLKFTVEKGVEVTPHYPSPNGKDETKVEYLTASRNGSVYSVTEEEFFGSTPLFYIYYKRIDVDNGKAKYDSSNLIWEISIKSISNLSISCNGQAYTSGKIYSGTDGDKLNITFQLDTVVGDSSSGSVEFNIKINGVTATYSVVVITVPVITVQQNFLSSNLDGVGNDTEVIFAEDLSKYSSQNLFEQNRLIEAVFTQAAVGKNLTLQYTKETESKFINVTPKSKGKMFIDAGESLTGYTFSAITYNGIKADDYLETEPVLTQRVQLRYYDGTPVTINKRGSEDADPSKAFVNISIKRPDQIKWRWVKDDKETTTAPFDFEYYTGLNYIVTLNNGDVSNEFEIYVDDYLGYHYMDVDFNVSNFLPFFNQEDLDDGYYKIKDTIPKAVSWGSDIKDVISFKRVQDNYTVEDLDGDQSGDGIVFGAKSNAVQNLEEFTLLETDFRKTLNLNFSVEVDNQDIEVNPYKIYLTADFQVVQNANQVDEYYTVDIKAGEVKSLLDDMNGYGISKLDGTNYTKQIMRNENKQFGAFIYGASKMMRVSQSDDELSGIAYGYHNAIKNREEVVSLGGGATKTIKYHAGINPYGSDSKLTNDGIFERGDKELIATLEGVSGGEQNTDFDYNIRAYGASNDGNMIMMRLVYTVEFGPKETKQTVKAEYNILIRVLPNTRVTFLESNNGYENEASQTLVDENGQTIHSNINTPYVIQTDEDNVLLYKQDEEKVDGLNEAIKIFVRGNQTNNVAKDFTYTFKFDFDKGEYNSWQDWKNTFESKKVDGKTVPGENATWWDVSLDDNGKIKPDADGGKTKDSLTSLQMNVPTITLGEHKFCIEAEDEFGFKIRFYFKKNSVQNPIIDENNSDITNLVEGDTLGFGSQYQIVDVSKDSSGALMYDSFKTKPQDSDDYIYQLNIDVPNFVEEGQTLTVTVSGTFRAVFGDKTYIKVDNLTTNAKKDASDKTKTISIPVTIFNSALDNNKWTNLEDNQEVDFKKEDYQKATITPYFKFAFEVKDPQNASIESQTTQTIREAKVYYTYTKKGENKGTNIYLNLKYNYGNTESPDLKNKAAPSEASGQQQTIVQKQIIFRGLNAYAFRTQDHVVFDGDYLENSTDSGRYISDFDTVLVGSIDFYQDKTWIGGSYMKKDDSSDQISGKIKTSEDDFGHTDTDSDKSIYGASLFTDDTYNFIEKSGATVSAKSGRSPEVGEPGSDTNNAFVIPYLTGKLYQYNETLPVRMAITVYNHDTKSENEYACDMSTKAVIYQNVTIKRKASIDVFKDYVIDDTSPELDPKVSPHNVYNDTLEIKLAPKEKVSFALTAGKSDTIDFVKEESGNYKISDKGVPYVKIGEEEVQAKLITVENPYTDTWITQYVSITNSLPNNMFYENLDAHTKQTEEGDTEYLGYYFKVYLIDNREKTADNSSEPKYHLNYGTTGENSSRVPQDIGFTDNLSSAYQIQQYSDPALRLNIEKESQMERSSYNYKEQTLYFLLDAEKTAYLEVGEDYNSTNTVYQFEKTFKVMPNYNTGSPAKDTTNKVNYDEVKKDDKSGQYYIIPYASWASQFNVKLLSEDGETELTSGKSELSGKDRKMFNFVINDNPVMGAGSAYIDEKGNIITNNNFDKTTHTITISVYQRVSGFYGAYEDKEKNIYLGQITISLEGELNGGSDNDGSTKEGVIIKNGNEVLTIPTGYSANMAYTSKITLPNEETFPNLKKDENNITFAYKTNQELDMHEMFDPYEIQDSNGNNKNIENGNNKNIEFNRYYHLVAYQKQKDDLQYVYYGNLDTYRGFSEKGTYTLYFVVTGAERGVTSSSNYNYYRATGYTYGCFAVEMSVYDDTSRERRVIEVTEDSDSGTGTYDLSGLKSEDKKSVKSWEVLNSDGTSQKLTNNTYTVTHGMEDVSLLATYDDGSMKLFDITFFKFDGKTVEKAVHVNPGESYKLEQLFPDLTEEDRKNEAYYEFYRLIGEDNTSFKDFQAATTWTVSGNNMASPQDFILVKTVDNNGKLETKAWKYSVTFYSIRSTSPTNLTLVLPEVEHTVDDEPVPAISVDDIYEKVSKYLKLEGFGNTNYQDKSDTTDKYLSIMQKASNGTLTTLNYSNQEYIDIDQNSSTTSGIFIVSYRATAGGSRNLDYFVISFYTYNSAVANAPQGNNGEYELNLYMPKLTDVNGLNVSEISENVKKLVGAEANDAVTFYNYDEEKFMLGYPQPVTRIALDWKKVDDGNGSEHYTFDGIYYVRVGQKFYLLKLHIDNTFADTKLPAVIKEITEKSYILYKVKDNSTIKISEFITNTAQPLCEDKTLLTDKIILQPADLNNKFYNVITGAETIIPFNSELVLWALETQQSSQQQKYNAYKFTIKPMEEITMYYVASDIDKEKFESDLKSHFGLSGDVKYYDATTAYGDMFAFTEDTTEIKITDTVYISIGERMIKVNIDKGSIAKEELLLTNSASQQEFENEVYALYISKISADTKPKPEDLTIKVYTDRTFEKESTSLQFANGEVIYVDVVKGGTHTRYELSIVTYDTKFVAGTSLEDIKSKIAEMFNDDKELQKIYDPITKENIKIYDSYSTDSEVTLDNFGIYNLYVYITATPKSVEGAEETPTSVTIKAKYSVIIKSKEVEITSNFEEQSVAFKGDEFKGLLEGKGITDYDSFDIYNENGQIIQKIDLGEQTTDTIVYIVLYKETEQDGSEETITEIADIIQLNLKFSFDMKFVAGTSLEDIKSKIAEMFNDDKELQKIYDPITKENIKIYDSYSTDSEVTLDNFGMYNLYVYITATPKSVEGAEETPEPVTIKEKYNVIITSKDPVEIKSEFDKQSVAFKGDEFKKLLEGKGITDYDSFDIYNENGQIIQKIDLGEQTTDATVYIVLYKAGQEGITEISDIIQLNLKFSFKSQEPQEP